MTEQKRRIPARRIVSIVLGWLHVALIFAPIYAGIVNFFNPGFSQADILFYHLRGMLFVIPVALSWFAIRYLRHILFYLAASISIIALAVVLFGTKLMIIPTLLLCFLRFYNRLTGEAHPLLDHAVYLVIPLFLLPAAVSFFYPAVDALYQTTAPFCAALYFLLCFAQRGIGRIDGYIAVNHTMRNLPVRRIALISAATLGVILVIFAAILLPPLLQSRTAYRYTPPPVSAGNTAEPEITPEPQTPADGTDWMQTLESEPNPFLIFALRILEYIVIAAVSVGLVFGVIFGALRLSRSFRRSFRDTGDLVENLESDAYETVREKRRRRDRPGLFDRTPNAVVRRRYRRTILRAAKEPPQPWMSPAEAEAHAKLSGDDADRLHALYEKARYSAEGCSKQDAAGL